MPYGHSQSCNGIIQGKHLGHYTCKCVNYQEYYFNRFFTDSFSCLSHTPSQRPTQAGMQAREDTKRDVGIQRVLLLPVLPKPIAAWGLQKGRENKSVTQPLLAGGFAVR